jgi:hypothetical protein
VNRPAVSCAVRAAGLVVFVAGCNQILGLRDFPIDVVDANLSGVALVQQSTNVTQSGITLSTSFASVPAAGDLLVMTGAAATTNLTAVTGAAAGSGWTFATGSFDFANMEIWYAIASGTAADVTFTSMGPVGPMFLSVTEWTGIDPGVPFDTGSAASGSSGTAALAMITQHPDLVVFALSSTQGTSLAAPSGFDPLVPVSYDTIAGAWYELLPGGVGASAAVFAPGDWDAALAGFVVK